MSEEVNQESAEPAKEAPAQASWKDSLDASFRNDPSISRHEDIQSLVREHVNAQSLLGRKGIIVPKEGDDDLVWQNYRDALGVPSSPNDYKLEGFNPPEAIPWDTDLQSKMLQVAAESNVPDAAMAKLLATYAEWAESSVPQLEQQAAEVTQQNIAQLKKEFGAAFDSKIGVAEAATNALTNGKPETLAQVRLADGTFLGDNPAFVKVMAEVGKSMVEKGLLGEKTVNNTGMTPEEALKQLDRLEADPQKYDIIYNQPRNPAHKELVSERDRLLSFAYPEEG